MVMVIEKMCVNGPVIRDPGMQTRIIPLPQVMGL